MLDNLSIGVQAKDVDAGPITIVRPVLVAVQNDEVLIGEYSAELHSFSGIRVSHPLEVVDERVLAIGDHRIVLSVRRSYVSSYRFAWLRVVEHQVVECGDSGFVGFNAHVVISSAEADYHSSNAEWVNRR